MMYIRSIFNRLEGPWAFKRTVISQCHTLPSGKVKGSVTFKRVNENLLHYQEEGTLVTREGKRFNIKRKYAYRFMPELLCIKKCFLENNSEERLFYTLDFSCNQTSKSCQAEGMHQCLQDNYHALYRFLGEAGDFNAFELLYEVRGPKKAYTSKTYYSVSLAAQKETMQTK